MTRPTITHDGEHVIIDGHRLTVAEARDSLVLLRDALNEAETAMTSRYRREARESRRARYIAGGWEPSESHPDMLLSLEPGLTLVQSRQWLGDGRAPYPIRHRPVPVRTYGGRYAHIATGGDHCACGAWLGYAKVLPADHGRVMCKAYRGDA